MNQSFNHMKVSEVVDQGAPRGKEGAALDLPKEQSTDWVVLWKWLTMIAFIKCQ